MLARFVPALAFTAFAACGDDPATSKDDVTTTTPDGDTGAPGDAVTTTDSAADAADDDTMAPLDADAADAPGEVEDAADTTAGETSGACHDGARDPGEACDDGDLDDLDGCDRRCQVTSVVRRPAPGEVVFAEILIDAQAVPDPDGEWLELVSVAAEPVSLGGCELVDEGTDRVVLDVDGGLALAPSTPWVAGLADAADNGGAPVDYVYTTMLFDNVADEVVLVCDGVEIDRVTWQPFTWPVVSGRALALDPTRADAAANDDPASWCLAERPFGAGDRGTPGAANPSCPQLDVEVDACRLLPAGLTGLDGFAGAREDVLVEVGEAGITDATEGLDASPSLLVDVGWGPSDAPPEGLAWSWSRAAGDATIDGAAGRDVYRGGVVVPDAGTVLVLGRASRDGGVTWRLCGRGGTLPAVPAPFVVAPSPCDASRCDDPPEATCASDGVTLLGFEPLGACTPTGATTYTCEHAPLASDCGALGLACDAGACAGTPRAPEPGEVLVTELMLRPTGGAPAQWVELEGQVDEPLALTGCVLTASSPDVVFPFSLVQPTVLGRSSRLVVGASRDLGVNGGAPVDRAWGEAVALPEPIGALRLTCGEDGGAPRVIDEVAWDIPPFPGQAGSSAALSPFRKDLDDNDEATSWCAGQASFGDGDRGSPGAPNPSCPGDVVPVDACALLGPAALTPPAGTTFEVPVAVVVKSLTGKTTRTDPSPKLFVELGVATRGATPAAITAWQPALVDDAWIALPNQGIPLDQDRYRGLARAPAPGAWDVYARVSGDGGNTWATCDHNGIVAATSVGVPVALAPVASACEPDPCGAPPAAGCDGDVVVSYVTPSTCTLDGGSPSCGFTEVPGEDCADAGATCEAGACVRFPRPPTRGEVVVSELLIQPPTGELGEWLELTNPGETPMDLTGCGLRSGAEAWDLPTPSSPLLWVLMPGTSLVMARSLSPSLNGGVSPRVAWSGIGLGNAADVIQLVCGGAVIDTVAWDSDDGWTVPTHRALQLSSTRMDADDNDFAASFCAPASHTAGRANLACPVDDVLEACTLDAAPTLQADVGAAVDVAVLIEDDGVTDARPGPDPAYGMIVDVGFGPADAEPLTSYDWRWSDASAEGAAREDGADRWRGALVPAEPGDFVVAARVSLDGGASWQLCDRSGLDDGFAPDVALDVLAGPCAPNPCLAAPAPTCSGTNLVAGQSPGVCTIVGGAPSCAYPTVTFSCALHGGCNVDGQCNNPPKTPAAGDLVVSEVMRDSNLPAPDLGEWLELTNVSGVPVDLRGCLLTDADGELVVVDGPLPDVVPAGGWAVFARSTDKTINGGVQPTSGALRALAGMALGNVADGVVVVCDGVEVDRVSWDASWPGSTGVSMQLTRTKTNAADNDAPGNWCAAAVFYGTSGNRGSPGLDNPTCP